MALPFSAEGSCVTVLQGGGAGAFDVVLLTSFHDGHGGDGAAPDDDAPESSDCNALRSSRALNSGVIDLKSLAKSA